MYTIYDKKNIKKKYIKKNIKKKYKYKYVCIYLLLYIYIRNFTHISVVCFLKHMYNINNKYEIF